MFRHSQSEVSSFRLKDDNLYSITNPKYGKRKRNFFQSQIDVVVCRGFCSVLCIDIMW